MPETVVVRVAIENINPLWPQIAPQLQRSLDLVGTHDPEDVRKLLLIGAAHLWVQWSDRVDACVVTQFMAYPKGLWLRIWLAGSASKKVDWKAFGESTKAWAVANQCKRRDIVGRPAWLRLFPEARMEGIIMSEIL